MKEDNKSNQKGKFNEADFHSKEQSNANKEIQKETSLSNQSVNANIREAENNVRQAKSKTDGYIKADIAQSEQLANADQQLKDKYSRQTIANQKREEAQMQADADRVKRAAEEERKLRSKVSGQSNLIAKHNGLNAIKHGSKGGGYRSAMSNKKPTPNYLLPKKVSEKQERFKTGKTVIVSAIAKELFGNYNVNSVKYRNQGKIDQQVRNIFHSKREEYISEGFTIQQADGKANQDAEEWHNNQSKKVTKTTHGADSSIKSREHKMRVEAEAKIASQKYQVELNDFNLHLNFMLDNLYSVQQLNAEGEIIDVQNPILTNDPTPYSDTNKYKVTQNFDIKKYSEMSREKRTQLTNEVPQRVKAEFNETMKLREDAIDRPYVTYLKQVQRISRRNNAIRNIRTTKTLKSKLHLNLEKDLKAVSKKVNDIQVVSDSIKDIKQDIADLSYLIAYAEDPTNPTFDKVKAKSISVRFGDVKNKVLIADMVKEKEEKLLSLSKRTPFIINDIYKLLNAENIEQRKIDAAKHFDITDVEELSPLDLIELLSRYREVEVIKSEQFITDLLAETNEGKEQVFTFDTLKNHKVLGKYFSEITIDDVEKFKNTEEYINYKNQSLSIIAAYQKKCDALQARYPDKIFSTKDFHDKGIINATGINKKDLDNDAVIATHLLFNTYSPLTKTSNTTMKEDFTALYSINEILYNLGFGEGEKTRLAVKDNTKIKTHVDGILAFPTGSTLIKPIDVKDMIAAFLYRHKRLYSNYDLYDANIHLDEIVAGAHIHFEHSTRNRFTKEYDIREHKTKLVNDFYNQDYVHRQSLKSDFVATLDDQLKAFLAVSKAYPTEVNGDHLIPFIQTAFEDFIEKNEVEAYNFGKVRPEIQSLIISHINLNTRRNHKERAEGNSETPLDLLDLTKRIRAFVIKEYDRKPIYFTPDHRTKIEQQVFGYHWEALNTHVIAKEFFGSPEMKKKYSNLVFAMSDIAEEKQSIVTKNYHRQKGYYTDGIRGEYLDMPDDDFIKLVQHNVAKSINPFQAAYYQEEQQLAFEKEFEEYKQQQITLAKKQQLKEVELLKQILAKQEDVEDNIQLTIKKEESIKQRLYELSQTPEAQIQKSILSEFTMSSLLVSKLSSHQMFLILDKYSKQTEAVKNNLRQTVLQYKDNLKSLIADGGNVDHSPNIVFAEYVLNVEPIVKDTTVASYLMSEGRVHKHFNPNEHFTPAAQKAYHMLKDDIGLRFGNVSVNTYLPYISEIVQGNDIKETKNDFKDHLIELYENDDYEFVAADFDYIDKNELDNNQTEKPVHQVTKRLKPKLKYTPE